ncbi:aldehyde dehydrogenase family protein (plasmid) [Shinella sp. H4-D48]|uniref:aldehyde dehydrogenase family protein n=1 Tax=Shinella sp. H4-D48 TaxID=2925841 RepID=UPI001F53120F|nr:aldehyde dehydrogenase family protein [Shinella sp. H4-D48]UNK39946.1 aldehyde dehydrogenase family protein [Shinella sp. H4-D48]
MTIAPEIRSWRDRAEGLKLEGRLFIDGDFVPAQSGAVFESINPANGDVLVEVARGDAADVDLAVAVALKAFKGGAWSRIAPRKRMATLYRFADLIEAHTEEFALIDTMDMGKPISEMLNVDVPLALTCLRFTTECIDKLQGTVGTTSPDTLSYVLRQPLGVVGCIVR